MLHARGEGLKTLRFLAKSPTGDLGTYDLDGDLKLRRVEDASGAAWTAKQVATTAPVITADASSVLYVEADGRRWRLPKGDAAFDQAGALGSARQCREVCTERNLLNVHGTFYEVPAENAGGFIKLRPIATHNRRIHDFTSYRGLLAISGIDDQATGEHIIRSDDGKCALWLGTVDDLWAFGKARGHGGPWLDTAVKAGVPSDPYLASGYDRKRLTLSHQSKEAVMFKLEADFTGTGAWHAVTRLDVKSGTQLVYDFPDSFGAYWLRLTPAVETTATARFDYN